MQEITALPVVVPLAVLTFALMVWRLYRRTAVSAPRVVIAILACVYGAGVVANTLLPIYVGDHSPRPPWQVFINLTPLVDTEPTDMLRNILLFLPLGLLLPLLTRAESGVRVPLYGLAINLAMEALQFVGAVAWHNGHVADINDLLSATIGVVLGYGVFRGLLLVPVAKRLTEACMLPPREGCSRSMPQ